MCFKIEEKNRTIGLKKKKKRKVDNNHPNINHAAKICLSFP